MRPSPGSYVEFIDHVLPVLRTRGLAKTGYAEGTPRRKATGRDRLPASHPAAAYRARSPRAERPEAAAVSIMRRFRRSRRRRRVG
jgi:hypothetical protein